MINFKLEGQIGRALDKFSVQKIILGGLLAVLFLGIITSVAVTFPLSQKIHNDLTAKVSLEQKISLLESEVQERIALIPEGFQLPAALSALQDCFSVNSLTFEEITISHLTEGVDGELNEAVVKVYVQGDREPVFKAINELTNLKTYPFLIEELDLKPTETVLYLKILWR
ncbi:MAG TPA: hypothetical protein GXX46_00955 [Peptococcaceae bacterium]|nr:hypothetical protein [Peptococcaceae bacterium]